MSTENWISLASAIVSVVCLIATIYFSMSAKTAAREANSISMGQAETNLRSSVSCARGKVMDAGKCIAEVLKGHKKEHLATEARQSLDFAEKVYRSALEDFLNVYEDACAKYLDGKIDKDRFKKMYIREIGNLCLPSSEGFKELMHPEGTSKFQAIWKVYHEWFTLEK